MSYKLVEEYFLKVERLFGESEYAEGKNLLEEILRLEPAYGRAHNHLGWLYYAKFDHYGKAEYHYGLAKKYAPEYPASYINLSYLLVETGKYEMARENARDALAVSAVSRSRMYNELGRIDELTNNYKAAIANYSEAIRLSMSKHEIDTYNVNISRVREKMNLSRKRSFNLW
jgi:tetratricopeptide (TPR) repeat protein